LFVAELEFDSGVGPASTGEMAVIGILTVVICKEWVNGCQPMHIQAVDQVIESRAFFFCWMPAGQ
jgi:hypothetical protein